MSITASSCGIVPYVIENNSIASGSCDLIPYVVYPSGTQTVTHASDGGAIVGYTASHLNVRITASTGGGIVGDSAYYVRIVIEVVDGGGIVGGTQGMQSATMLVDGGSIAGGLALINFIRNELTNAGAIIGGTAVSSNVFSFSVLGGSIVGGLSSYLKLLNTIMTSGAISGGTTSYNKINQFSSTNGSIGGGLANQNYIAVYPLSYVGVIAGGSSTINNIVLIAVDGGAEVGGTSSILKGKEFLSYGGGVVSASIIPIRIIDTYATSGGIGGGRAFRELNIFSSIGGAIAGGISESIRLNIIPISYSGGVVGHYALAYGYVNVDDIENPYKFKYRRPVNVISLNSGVTVDNTDEVFVLEFRRPVVLDGTVTVKTTDSGNPYVLEYRRR